MAVFAGLSFMNSQLFSRPQLGVRVSLTVYASPFDNDARSAGTYLGERMGDQYAAIGLIAQTVRWNWPGQVEGEQVSDDNTLEHRLSSLGEPYLLMDTRDATGPDGFVAEDEVFDFGNPSLFSLQPRTHFPAVIYADVSDVMQWWAQ